MKSTCTRAYVHNLCVGLSDCEMNWPWPQTRCPLCPLSSAPMAAINMPGEEAWIRQADPTVPPGPIFRGKKMTPIIVMTGRAAGAAMTSQSNLSSCFSSACTVSHMCMHPH